MPFLPILGLIFITLKLMGFIAWSWWLVLLPLYGGALLWLALFLAGATALLTLGGIATGRRKRF